MDCRPTLTSSRSRSAGCPRSTATYLTASNISFSTAASWCPSQTTPIPTESSSTFLNNRRHTARMMRTPASIRTQIHGRGKGRHRKTPVTVSGGPSKAEAVRSPLSSSFITYHHMHRTLLKRAYQSSLEFTYMELEFIRVVAEEALAKMAYGNDLVNSFTV